MHLPSWSGEQSPAPKPRKSQGSGLSRPSGSPGLVADHAEILQHKTDSLLKSKANSQKGGMVERAWAMTRSRPVLKSYFSVLRQAFNLAGTQFSYL